MIPDVTLPFPASLARSLDDGTSTRIMAGQTQGC